MNSPKISAPAPTVDAAAAAAAVDVCQLYVRVPTEMVHYKSPLKSLIRSDLTDSVVGDLAVYRTRSGVFIARLHGAVYVSACTCVCAYTDNEL